MGNWYTGTNTNSIRTTWIDSLVYPKPYATAYDSTQSGSYPTVIGESGLGRSVLFEHEIGTDQVNPNGTTTTVTSFIESFDIDLEQRQRDARGRASGPKVAGEIFLAMRRFVPDFKTLQGNS